MSGKLDKKYVEIGGFKTIKITNGGTGDVDITPLAGDPTEDTLQFDSGDGITLTANQGARKVTIGASLAGSGVATTVARSDHSHSDLYYNTIAKVTATDAGATTGGTHTATIGFNVSSSKRWKKDIRDLTNALQVLKQLNGKTYLLKEDSEKGPQFGLIAEDVFNTLPAIVSVDDEGIPSGVNYTALIPFLLEGVKELTERVEALERVNG